MSLPFDHDEFAARQGRLLHVLDERRLVGILLFRPESLYWLTGYDSLGYVFFQCLYVGADGALALFSRPQDLEQARLTSIVREVHVWTEREDRSPTGQLVALLAAKGCRGARLGVEFDASGLTFSKARALEAGLAELCHAEDASHLVTELRACKSPAELAYVRRAAVLADDAMEAVAELARPGQFDGELFAAAHGAIFRGGGGYPANECILSSGEEALLVRHHGGRRHLGPNDQLTAEFAASYRRYHAGILRTVLTGAPSQRQHAMHAACREALLAAEAQLGSGTGLGEVFDAHARVLEAAGFREQRLHTCGYSLGATFPPTWVDWPFIHAGTSTIAREGMVLLLLVFLLDPHRGHAYGLGRTAIVTDRGCEPLSRLPLEPIINA